MKDEFSKIWIRGFAAHVGIGCAVVVIGSSGRKRFLMLSIHKKIWAAGSESVKEKSLPKNQ